MSRSFPLISKDKVGVIDASVDRATSPSDLSRQEPSSQSGVDLPKRYKSLAEAQRALSHLNALNRAKALAKVGVDWSIGEQSDEAELARHMATYSAIFEAQSGVAEAKEAAAWHWECKRRAAR